jgi:hypothetical protein
MISSLVFSIGFWALWSFGELKPNQKLLRSPATWGAGLVCAVLYVMNLTDTSSKPSSTYLAALSLAIGLFITLVYVMFRQEWIRNNREYPIAHAGFVAVWSSGIVLLFFSALRWLQHRGL